MTMIQCATVREVLPEHVRETLAVGLRPGVESHLARCAECAAEAALVALLARQPVVPPAGLDERIVAAVRSAPARPQLWLPARAALAATVVGALLGGALLVRQGGIGAPPAPQVSLVEEAVQQGALTWLAEPLLSGGPALHELSVDELEALLVELES